MKMQRLIVVLLGAMLFALDNGWAATITATPANIAQGNNETATFSGIAAPTNRDWIGLYTPAAANTAFLDWIYTNTCSRNGGNSVLANGSCGFPIVNSIANGTYQLRLFSNNGYTLLATSNNFTVGPPPPARFVDNGDGTISDTQTGLMWEMKLAATDSRCTNATQANRDIHCVNNQYVWSATEFKADGDLFTDFLTQINRADGASNNGQTQGRKNFSDWRIPTIAELRGILLAKCPGSPTPCIDPVFGPTALGLHWSSTNLANVPSLVFIVNFVDGNANNDTSKLFSFFARAVRGGR
ncbi:MAG: DUF1566 domain-containing protein [Deltaproteobacteria bacterium]|nr:DUF1566 domain-containing protein [Deltaproteobacteria bacterium]